MKSKVSPGTTARTMGKVFLALALGFTAAVIGFGGTAFFVYHQLGSTYDSSGRQATKGARRMVANHGDSKRAARSQPNADETATERSEIRQVAASSSDRPVYTYADNDRGGSTSPIGHSRSNPPASRATTMVPAPLDGPASSSNDESANRPPQASRVNLSDPESRLIVDSRTGRVIGIDGSAGAAAEEQQQQLVAPAAAPVTVRPAQAVAPEVRVAAPVIVKRAIPVESSPTSPEFNAADEVSLDDTDRPVLRAQPVLPPGARVVKTLHIYRLPNGSQVVANN